MEENIGPKDRKRIAILEASEAGKQLLRRKGKKTSTKVIYVRGALLFSEYLGKSLDQIVNEYKADVEANLVKGWEKWEEVFADFGDYLTQKHGEGTTAKTYFEGAKALINCNVPKSARIKPESPTGASRTIPPITMEDLRTLRGAADERERAFIDFLKDSGVSRDDAVKINYKEVKKAVEDQTITAHKINMYRGKENVEYETWIGVNAIESLRIYFMVRRQRGEQITDATPIFASNTEPYERLNVHSLSAVFRRLAKRTGITVSTHRLRKTFETYITAGGAHPLVAKYWTGHKIKGRDIEASYIIPPEDVQRDIYLRAYPYLDVRPQISVEELSKAKIESELDTMDPKARKSYVQALVKRFGYKPSMKRLLDDIAKQLDKEEENTDCPNGVHCAEEFAQINENELLTYLQQGYTIVHTLANGEVIVKR